MTSQTQEDGEQRSRLQRIFLRFERVLELAEEALCRLRGVSLSPEFFSDTLAFRWRQRGDLGALVPVQRVQVDEFQNLLGIDTAIDKLCQNTEQFVRGFPFNHVLLYGERGTGKSSLVKALLGRFSSLGLRLVEVGKKDLFFLPEILEQLRPFPFRFLVFVDDLSFAEGQEDYRELKAILDGGVEATPENVCLIATSNRRHLLPEYRAELRSAHVDARGELRLGESVDEKLALADRFGLAIGFYGFDQETYLRIVARYAERAGIDIHDDVLREEALRWALDRSNRSGRTAKQFVAQFAGRVLLERSTTKNSVKR